MYSILYIFNFSTLSSLGNFKLLDISHINWKDLNQNKWLIKMEIINLSENIDLTNISSLSKLVNWKKLNFIRTKINNIKTIKLFIRERIWQTW